MSLLFPGIETSRAKVYFDLKKLKLQQKILFSFLQVSAKCIDDSIHVEMLVNISSCLTKSNNWADFWKFCSLSSGDLVLSNC
jgi:hypothetical protein